MPPEQSSDNAAPADVAPFPAISATPAPSDTATTVATEPASSPDNEAPAGPNSLLDALKQTVGPAEDDDPATDEAPAPPAPEGDGDAEKPAANSTDETDPTDAELQSIEKPRIRKWVQRALSQRDEAKAALATYETAASNWQAHSNWMQAQGISGDDQKLLYGVAATLRSGDFEAFLRLAQPYIDAARVATGDKLPRDLEAAVADGRIETDMAREVARSRTQAAVAQERATTATQQQQAMQVQNQGAAIRDAVDGWESTMRQRDPDFAAKSETILAHAQSMVLRNGRYPADAAEAVEWMQQAYRSVDSLFSAARPAPQATRPLPTSASSAAPANATPNSLREAMEMALRRTS